MMTQGHTPRMNPLPQTATGSFTAPAQRWFAALCLLLPSCGGLPPLPFLKPSPADTVIYALPPRSGTSPLNATLTPACPALVFDQDAIRLASSHEQAVRRVATECNARPKKRLLIAGYSRPDLPPGHARALSDRRSHAVRQRLIELGMEAADVQTVGFGNDFAPTAPSSDVVVIYQHD